MDPEAGPSSPSKADEFNKSRPDSDSTHSLVKQLTNKTRVKTPLGKESLEQLLDTFKTQLELQTKQFELLRAIVKGTQSDAILATSDSESGSVEKNSEADLFTENDLARALRWEKKQRPDSLEILELGKEFLGNCKDLEELWFASKNGLPAPDRYTLDQIEADILQQWPNSLGHVSSSRYLWDLNAANQSLRFSSGWDVRSARFIYRKEGGMRTAVEATNAGGEPGLFSEPYTDVPIPSGKLIVLRPTSPYPHSLTLRCIAFLIIHMHASLSDVEPNVDLATIHMIRLYTNLGYTFELGWGCLLLGSCYQQMFAIRYFAKCFDEEAIPGKWRPSLGEPSRDEIVSVSREQGHFFEPPFPILIEKQCIFRVVSQFGTATPCFNLVRLGNATEQIAYLRDEMRYDGQFAAMHLFVDHVAGELIGVCEVWSSVLGGMDSKLRATVTDLLDENIGHELMFDEKNFKQSRLYFTLQQLCRIFEKCAERTLADLEESQKSFFGQFVEEQVKASMEEELEALDKHWTETMSEPKKQLESILNRIRNKREEVESLRDGLFNATSVREASRGTEIAEISIRQNQYLFVFTIMTVIYLPLGFVTSIFGMHLFDTEDFGVVAARPKFYITLVVLSISTYIAAGLAYWLVRSRKKDGSARDGLPKTTPNKQEKDADSGPLETDEQGHVERGISALLRNGIRDRKNEFAGRNKGKGKEASTMV